ncbi:MAG: YdeI/OmpD-associated family protein [Clostridia bacterium]|nr:YdeI/OmpD-associated family protein [Clostridia bacterium]
MELFYTDSRSEWRAWLSAHFETAQEVWFVFPTKASGEPAVSYNDAVEEALCFGWIDGRAGTLDETHHIRRFTPRRKGSPYSRPNIERLLKLDAAGQIHPRVRESVLPIIYAPFVWPADILDALKADETVWEHYQSFPEAYRRIRVAYIDAARKRPAEFQKRLASFIEKTRRNQLIRGYGGIDAYYTEEEQ